MKGSVQRELPFDAAESQTLSMRGNSMRENRETPATPSADGGEGRSEKANCRTSDAHVAGESDGLIVPTKRANKAAIQLTLWDRSAAESVEGSRPTKGNADQTTASRTQSRTDASSGLEGIRRAAKRHKDARFSALLHHVTPELLENSFYALKREASPGIDGVTWRQYGHGLQERLADLHERVHRGTYRAQPSRRVWIPKADGRERPLGIACLEDKIVQQAIKTILEQIYEEDFLGFSYGFRPGRSQHGALDALWVGISRRNVNWVLDADIRGFFDAIDHECLMKFIERRISDRRVLRLIRKWLRAGVSEDGVCSRTKVGTPQGSVISPLLANVYLHYVLDQWIHHWRYHPGTGSVIVVRYADDFVMGFQRRSDAERCLRDLQQRFQTYGLELHPDKTRLLEFGRWAERSRAGRGLGKPETFDFLGFTHCCGKTRRGRFIIKRRSIAKRMRSKLREIKLELRRRMHEAIPDQGTWLRSVVGGWFRYHAVPDNHQRLNAFRQQVIRYWLHALRRRSQKGRQKWTWRRMAVLAKRWLPLIRILHPYPNARLIVTDLR